MAKRTVSFGDYKEADYEEYTGEDPRSGVWLDAKVVRAKYDKEEDQMVFYVSVVNHPDYTGWTRGVYAPFEGNQKWKLQELLRAVQGGVSKDVTLDWENEVAVGNWLKKLPPIRIQTREYNDRLSIGKTRALISAVPDKAAKKAAPVAVVEEAPEIDEDALEDYTAEELAEMEVKDLIDILTDEFKFSDEDLPKKLRNAAAYKKKLVEAILEVQAEEEEGEDGEDADPYDDDNEEFEDGFDDGDEDDEEEEGEPEPEPEPEPAPRRRRPAPAKAAPAKAAPAKAAPAATRRRRG